jgi:hypothetical protein
MVHWHQTLLASGRVAVGGARVSLSTVAVGCSTGGQITWSPGLHAERYCFVVRLFRYLYARARPRVRIPCVFCSRALYMTPLRGAATVAFGSGEAHTPGLAVPRSGSRVVSVCRDPSTSVHLRHGTNLALGHAMPTITFTTCLQPGAFALGSSYEPRMHAAVNARALASAVIVTTVQARSLSDRFFIGYFHSHHSGAGAEMSSSPQLHGGRTGSAAPQVGVACSPQFPCAVHCF